MAMLERSYKDGGILTFILLQMILVNTGLYGQYFERTGGYRGERSISPESGIKSPVTIVVLYDNYVSEQGTTADWGFSVLIEGLEKCILFDTGTKPEILGKNIHETGIDPSRIDMLILSHEHQDHTGGITSLTKLKTGIPVLFPEAFSESFPKNMNELGLEPVYVGGSSVICQNLYTSGQFDHDIPEEALVLDTKSGLVVITGCAHPGIIMMLTRIKNDFGKNIYMVCGGFHLLNKTDEEMKKIISAMKQLGIVKCGATHCTGEKQIKMFREAFGKNYLELGTGNRITIN